MNKMKVFSCIVFIATFWFANLSARAQQPEAVDVVFFTTHHTRTQTDTNFTMTVRNSNGFTNYAGRGSYSLTVFNCIPCSIPNTFSSDGFSVGFSGFNWGFDKYLRFYVTAIESDPIILSPMIPRKRKNITVSGKTRLRGRIEIKDENNMIIAFDNDVVLEGRYIVNFIRPVYNSGVVEFTQISYLLNQPFE